MLGMYQEQSLGSILRSLRETYGREIRIAELNRELELTRFETPTRMDEPPRQPEPPRK